MDTSPVHFCCATMQTASPPPPPFFFLLFSFFLKKRAPHPLFYETLTGNESAPRPPYQQSPPRELVDRVFSKRASHCYCPVLAELLPQAFLPFRLHTKFTFCSRISEVKIEAPSFIGSRYDLFGFNFWTSTYWGPTGFPTLHD